MKAVATRRAVRLNGAALGGDRWLQVQAVLLLLVLYHRLKS